MTKMMAFNNILENNGDKGVTHLLRNLKYIVIVVG